MTLAQLLDNADSRELSLWLALYELEGDEAGNRALAARAESALAQHRASRK